MCCLDLVSDPPLLPQVTSFLHMPTILVLTMFDLILWPRLFYALKSNQECLAGSPPTSHMFTHLISHASQMQDIIKKCPIPYTQNWLVSE